MIINSKIHRLGRILQQFAAEILIITYAGTRPGQILDTNQSNWGYL